MEKNRMIIVEGPQGTGKTNLTNYLRDNIAGSNLYRLSGQKDKSIKGKEKSQYMYNIQLDYLEGMSSIPMDLIFDRTFFAEEVYARLGFKDYQFSDVYYTLLDRLSKLDYDIYLILLYLKDVELYRVRLARKNHHLYQSFSLKNSVNQQHAYQELGNEIKKNHLPITVEEIAMDNFDEAYEKVRRLLKIEEKEE